MAAAGGRCRKAEVLGGWLGCQGFPAAGRIAAAPTACRRRDRCRPQVKRDRLTLVDDTPLHLEVAVTSADEDASYRGGKDQAPAPVTTHSAGNGGSTAYAGTSDAVGALAFFTEAQSLEACVTETPCRTMALPREVRCRRGCLAWLCQAATVRLAAAAAPP
jgi:hypothetical protein